MCSKLSNVYKWMTMGLGITALTGYLTSMLMSSIMIMGSAFNILWFVATFITLLFVIGFSFNFENWSWKQILGTYVGITALNGIMLAPLFYVCSLASVYTTFGIVTAMFIVLTIIGRFINKDLTSWTPYLLACLIGLIIATVVNIFVANGLLFWITTYAGVLIFTGITIYDVNKINKRISKQFDYCKEDNLKAEISGALDLYLDFINLFVLLVRFTKS